jgi:hypothetical protein
VGSDAAVARGHGSGAPVTDTEPSEHSRMNNALDAVRLHDMKR